MEGSNESGAGVEVIEPQAALEFHALCEGLAALEERGILPADEAEHIWRDALRALVAGWAATG